MKKVLVKNISDQPVSRLGHVWNPGEEKEIELGHQNHLFLLNACKYLEVKEAQAEKTASKKKKE